MSLRNVIKYQLYVSLLIVTLLMLGCTSYKPAVSKSLLTPDFLAKNEVVVNSGGREIHLVIIKDRDLALDYVGFDPTDKEMVPVFIRIVNGGKDIIKADFSRSALVTDKGDNYQGLSIEEAIDKVKIGDDEAIFMAVGAVTAGAAGAVAGALIAGSNADVKQTLASDYYSKSFKPSLIMADHSGQGLVFFPVPLGKLNQIKTANIHLLQPLSHEAADVSITLNSAR